MMNLDFLGPTAGAVIITLAFLKHIEREGRRNEEARKAELKVSTATSVKLSKAIDKNTAATEKNVKSNQEIVSFMKTVVKDNPSLRTHRTRTEP
jgi:hypothetical protein